MKPDFSAMTKRELRAYVVAHPDDKSAFHAFVDRFTAEAPSETFNIPESHDDIETVDALIREKLKQLETT